MSDKFAGMNMEVPSLKKVKECVAVTVISLRFKISFQLTKGGKFERIYIGQAHSSIYILKLLLNYTN